MAVGYTPTPVDAETETTTEVRYPCYVLSVLDFLKLDKFRSHEKLLRMGLLRPWEPSMHKKIIFVSHQWLGYHAVDPNNDHFRALHRLLSRLMNGLVPRVDAHWSQRLIVETNQVVKAEEWKSVLPHMYVWMDYFSMPQWTPSCKVQQVKNASDAIHSIPAYVELCSLILVLAPVCRHSDTGATCNFASWFERGWCRLEIWFARLSRREIDMMVCTGGESTPYFLTPLTFTTGVWDQGKFSCCEQNHQIMGRHVPCDKVRVQSILRRMLEAKVQYSKSEGRWMDMVYYSAIRLTSWAGQLGIEAPEDSATGFRKFVSWDHVDKEEAQKAGWSLLLLAAMCGQTGAVRELLASTPQDINRPVFFKVHRYCTQVLSKDSHP